MKEIKQMQKRILSYFIIITILIVYGCALSSGNKENSGQFGFWAKNTSFLSKRKPSIWQCALEEESQYQNKECN
tara:strand:- start:571 stop:792 length:222 start_codon:yes stop_codon:yes gene_type:complete